MDCPFCSVDESGTRSIYNGTHVSVILSDPRLVSGHLLVIPRRHVEDLWQLRGDERKELFEVVLEFQKKITSTYATGCDIRQNYRPFLQQSRLKVDHVHFHLIPREFEDDLYLRSQIFEKDIFAPLTEDEKKRFTDIFDAIHD